MELKWTEKMPLRVYYYLSVEKYINNHSHKISKIPRIFLNLIPTRLSRKLWEWVSCGTG